MPHDEDAEIVETVRATLDELVGRHLGEMISTREAEALVEGLQRRGVVLLLGDPPATLAEVDLGPAVRLNINVTTTADGIGAVLEQARAHGLTA
jgi:hypothetical protein